MIFICKKRAQAIRFFPFSCWKVFITIQLANRMGLVFVLSSVEQIINPYLSGMGGGRGVILSPPTPNPCLLNLNNSETIKVVTLAFRSIQ